MTLPRRMWLGASLVLVLLTACTGAANDDPPSDGSVELLVVLPADWPEPFYPGEPEIVIEGPDGTETRSDTAGRRTSVVLPAPGEYRVGAEIEDGGCYDTAGVASGGNPPVEVSDGDVVQLIDTGEICD